MTQCGVYKLILKKKMNYNSISIGATLRYIQSSAVRVRG